MVDPADQGWKRPADQPSRGPERPDRLQFGVVLQTDPPASRVVEMAKTAESLGFDHAWTFDSHVLWEEPFVIFSRILAETEHIRVGPMVTNPGTRDWTVLASLFATLNEMYGDRTICGIGRGDSALRYIGLKPTTLSTMVEAMEVIKDLVAGKEVSYNEELIRFPWIDGPGWDLPMWVAGYGPKALQTIGRHGDGFILQLADPQVLKWTVDAVRAAAEDVGRDPDVIDICVVAPAYVGDNIEHQREQLRWFGGMVGNHVADMVKRYGADTDLVPKALTDYIEAREGYDYDHHGKAGNPSTDFVPDEIVDRFCVLGTVEQHVEKLEELKELGADHFGIYLMHDDQESTLRSYGEQIIPAVNG